MLFTLILIILLKQCNLLQIKVAENVGLINLKDEEGQTPLHVACLEHPAKLDIIRFLLSHHADVNAIDSNGWTPLHGISITPLNRALILLICHFLSCM